MDKEEIAIDVEEALRRIVTKCYSDQRLNPFDEFIKFASDYYDKPVSSISELRVKRCTKFKGDIFEVFALLYLKHVYGLEQVWLLKETPEEVLSHLNLKRHDMGVDLIGFHNNNHFAIQAKYRTKPKNKTTYGVSWKDLSTFYALVNRTGPFYKHIVITNANFVRHVGGRSPKDLSICYGTLKNISLEQMRKMANFSPGQSLNWSESSSSSSNSNVINVPNGPIIRIVPLNITTKIEEKPKSELELLRERRLAYLEKNNNKIIIEKINESSFIENNNINEIAKEIDKIEDNKLDIVEIVPNIFLGSEVIEDHIPKLLELKINNLLCCACELDSINSSNINFMKLNLDDDPGEDISIHIPDCIDFINDCVKRNEKVLVYCHMGISRSVSILTSYLMTTHKKRYTHALEMIQEKRMKANPNLGFRSQLLNLDDVLFAEKW